MKIKDIRTLRAGRYLFVFVDTDSGITGLGEAGAWSYLEATEAAIGKCRDSLLGLDPFAIEHHQQSIYRSAYFRGSVIMSALSAIDIALWDIKGKALEVPVYELMGGKYRDRVRTYAPVFKFTAAEMASECVRLRREGFTAARLMITDAMKEGRGDIGESVYANRVGGAVEKVRACREAVGDGFDLCLEVHRSMTPAEAMAFLDAVVPLRPMFVEDPIPPDNSDAFAELARGSRVPLATGERFINLQEFQTLLARGGASYVRPDLCVVGGLSVGKKVAAVAEAYYAGVVPHNPLGPVSTAACLQLDACIPNLAIQEFPSFYEKGGECGMMAKPFEIMDGCILIPGTPGIGVELVPDIAERFPPRNDRRNFGGQVSFDGAVKDV